MKATFIELPPFERVRKDYMDDEAYSLLQHALMGTAKAKKLREAGEKLHNYQPILSSLSLAKVIPSLVTSNILWRGLT